MKKLIAAMLCMAILCTLLCACGKTEETPTQQTEATVVAPTIEAKATDPININGLDNGNATDEEIQQAMGRQPDAIPTIENGTELQIFNDVNWLGIDFKQVQYSRSEDHMLVTYCYSLSGETMEEALEGILDVLTKEYGEAVKSTGGSIKEMYTWVSGSSKNTIRLYPLTETEIRLQYTLPYTD